MKHPYSGSKIALPTKHKKGNSVQRAFDGILDVEIREISVDTDQLGTFSGEIPRIGSPLEVAIKKAELGAQKSGLPLAIASEGTIANDPLLPLVISDVEIMVFRDLEQNLLIKESHRSLEIKAARTETIDGNDLDRFLFQADFPNHGLIATGMDMRSTKPIKGIKNHHSLTNAIKEIRKSSPKVILENDFRALYSPSRMANIETTAKKLAKRIAALCPECASPGWGVIGAEKGVICRVCKQINPDAVHREILGCVKCEKQSAGDILNEYLPADRCVWCNP